ncbi:MAG: DUF4230 domain-containing protein [Chitinophagaceae bacterium]|nr:DUF4230 domain-containing protein [Chitinophagaceae bacterium]
MVKRLICIYILLLMAGCNNKEPKQPQEILALKEMNELVTVEYIVSKIIKANDNKTWYKFGDRKILMTCQATLKGGIDLSKIDETKVSINNKEISVVLPRATLLSINIKPEDIKVAYEEVGALRSGFSSQERDELASQAQMQIQSSADSLGVLRTAEANAGIFVSNFLRNLGYEKVTVKFDDSPFLPILN